MFWLPKTKIKFTWFTIYIAYAKLEQKYEFKKNHTHMR